MKSTIILSLFCLYTVTAFGQSTDEYLIILHKQKVSPNAKVGRVFGKVTSDSIKYDFSSYMQSYICKIAIGKISQNEPRFLYYLIGKKKDKGIYVTVDANFNNNFLDDKEIKIDSALCNNCNLKNWNGTVVLKRENAINEQTDSLTLHIVLPCCFPNLKRQSENSFLDTFNIALEDPIENIGKLYVSDTINDFSIRQQFPADNFMNYKRVSIFVKDIDNFKRYNLMDTMKIGDDFFKVNYLSSLGDSIILKKLSPENIQGSEVGFFPYSFSGKDIMSNALINPYNLNSKYLLIEFWGTWCSPCLSLHDDLVKFLKQKSNYCAYLGIAYDNNIKKVKKYILKSPELQRQIFVSNSANGINSLVNLFKITNYPTFILIDAKSKIVFKEFGIEGFAKLKEFEF